MALFTIKNIFFFPAKKSSFLFDGFVLFTEPDVLIFFLSHSLTHSDLIQKHLNNNHICIYIPNTTTTTTMIAFDDGSTNSFEMRIIIIWYPYFDDFVQNILILECFFFSFLWQLVWEMVKVCVICLYLCNEFKSRLFFFRNEKQTEKSDHWWWLISGGHWISFDFFYCYLIIQKKSYFWL